MTSKLGWHYTTYWHWRRSKMWKKYSSHRHQLIKGPSTWACTPEIIYIKKNTSQISAKRYFYLFGASIGGSWYSFIVFLLFLRFLYLFLSHFSLSPLYIFVLSNMIYLSDMSSKASYIWRWEIWECFGFLCILSSGRIPSEGHQLTTSLHFPTKSFHKQLKLNLLMKLRTNFP